MNKKIRHVRKHFITKIFFTFIFIGIAWISTFAQNWKLIEPKYPTVDDIVAAYSVANYGATGDGITDVTNLFQSLLDTLGQKGGGTLFVPEGKYVIRGTLLIPKGITLRGEWKKPVKGQPIVGTILMAYSGLGDENAAPFITMETSAAVMDLAIWYPDQLPINIRPYPPSIVFGKPNYFGNEFCNAKNITFVNSYTGLVFSRLNGGSCPVINGLYGTPLSRGVEIDNIADVGRIDWIDFSPDYWSGSGLANAPSKGGTHESWIYQNGTGIVMRRNDWSYTCNVNIEGYSKGFHAAPSIASPGAIPNGHNYSMTFTGCKTAIYLEVVSSEGIMFSRINVINCETGVEIAPNTSGAAQFHTCSINAYKNAIKVDSSSLSKLMLLQSDISKGLVDIEGGTFITSDCDFNNDTPQIMLKKNSRGIITGNRFAKTPQIENNSIILSAIDHTPLKLKKLPIIPTLVPETHKPSRIAIYVASEAPFNARNDGITDNTMAIQSALNRAGTDGGGIVFLPPGKYQVLGNLTIPTGVELKGSSDVSTTPTGLGSILEVYAGENAPSETPFLKLSQGSGVRGITFDYPKQIYTLYPNMHQYPYCIQATGSDTYIVNVGIRAAYNGIDLFTYKCDNHYIDFIAGHVFKTGIKVGGNSQGGRICNLQFNLIAYGCGGESKFGSWPNSAPQCENVTGEYGFNNLDFLILGDCKDELLYNNFDYGSHRGIILTSEGGSGPTGISLGLGIDGSRNAMTIESVGSQGFDFINSQIVAFGDQDTKYIETSSGVISEVTLYNSDFWGNPGRGIIMGGGKVTLQSANFEHPGQSGFANINSGSLNIESSTILPTNLLLNSGAEPYFSAQSSIIDTTGIIKKNCALWKNNLSNGLSFSIDAAINRKDWIVAASQNNGSAKNAIDGDAASRWDTQGSQTQGQWFTVNMNKKEKIDQILLDVTGSPNDSPKEYKMYVSDDGINWYGPALSGIGTDIMTILSFPSTTVQYVKILQTGTKSNYWSIHELNVFGDTASISVSGVSLKPVATTMYVDSTMQLTATIIPTNAVNHNIVWASNNPSAVSVDAYGLVKGISP